MKRFDLRAMAFRGAWDTLGGAQSRIAPRLGFIAVENVSERDHQMQGLTTTTVGTIPLSPRNGSIHSRRAGTTWHLRCST